MKLFWISQTAVGGYDTYSDAVVAAENEAQAREILPEDSYDEKVPTLERNPVTRIPLDPGRYDFGVWASDPEQVTAIYIGEAVPEIDTPRVISASFHAG